MRFGTHLRVLRVRSNLTLEELSRRSEVAVNRILLLEEHQTVIRPSIDEMEDLVICFTGNIERQEVYDIVEAGYEYLPDRHLINKTQKILLLHLTDSNRELLLEYEMILLGLQSHVKQ